MSNIEIPSFSTSIRFTSIEPILPINGHIREIACEHGFDIEIGDEQRINAPFCGVDYHIQEMKLTCCDTTNTSTGLHHCLNKLSTLEETKLADGYFEVIA